MYRREFISGLAAATSVIPLSHAAHAISRTVDKAVKPPRLRAGDTIGLVTPATYLTEAQLRGAIDHFAELGLSVRYTPNMLVRKGYLAGTDRQRADDINQFFADDTIDGIICGRGGYGSARILPYLNYDLIKSHPKVFMGYSDITAMLYALYGQANLIGFHGPMGTSDYNDYTTRYFREVLINPNSSLTYENPVAEAVVPLSADGQEPATPTAVTDPLVTLAPGTAEGVLVGGNLSLITSLCGTAYDVDLRDKLVFIEEVGEAPYRIDRMLTQLLLDPSKLPAAAGVVLGVFSDCEAKDESTSLSLAQVLHDRLAGLGIPVLYGLSFGHIKQNATVPFGVRARLDADKKTLTLLEAAVR
jgi:muramoyltetrapeptide carboxypeptidase